MILPLLITAASAVAAPCAVGNWILKAGDQTIFRLAIRTTATGTTAVWERPEHLDLGADSFSRVIGPVIHRSAGRTMIINGDIELSFDDPAPGATPDEFHLHCVNSDRLDVTYRDTGLEPFTFARERGKALPLGPWDRQLIYQRAALRSTNLEMTAIFAADQAQRQTEHIDLSIAGAADDKRRARTAELLESGVLESGDDFYHAAFIYQHGRTSEDYLKAHLLATIAVARGRAGAVWIASATLDRYLQAIGKPQVLGTQYMRSDSAPATQEPYDRSLLPDAMRKALHVPPLAQQEEQRRRPIGDGTIPEKP
jgi:hypothetical protein